MKLTFIDRILISELYPEKSNMVTLRLIKGMREKVDFTPPEILKYKMNTEVQGLARNVTWDPELNPLVDFDITLTDSEIGYLQDRINELDKNSSIPSTLLELCEKIKQG